MEPLDSFGSRNTINSQLEETQIFGSKLALKYSANNNIGNKGCKYLSRFNSVGIETIQICMHFSIQTATAYKMKE